MIIYPALPYWQTLELRYMRSQRFPYSHVNYWLSKVGLFSNYGMC